jgi:glucose-1-phosphate cytidylyltransferase
MMVAMEDHGLTRLAARQELNAFRHEGFWQPMDTYHEFMTLSKLWDSGAAPWQTW